MRIIRTLFPLAFACLYVIGIMGCSAKITIDVDPLTTQHFPAHPPGFAIDEWEIPPPTQSFVRLAEITAKGSPEDDDEILARVLEEARKHGADGVIIEKSDLLGTFDPQRTTPNVGGWSGGGIYSLGGSAISSGPGVFPQNAPEGFTGVFFISAIAIKYVP